MAEQTHCMIDFAYKIKIVRCIVGTNNVENVATDSFYIWYKLWQTAQQNLTQFNCSVEQNVKLYVQALADNACFETR